MDARSRHFAAWVVACSILAILVVVVLLVVGLRSAREGLTTRFDGRGQLASEFAAEYVRQVAARERRIAHAALSGDVDAATFSEVVTDQDFVAGVLLGEDGSLLQVHPEQDQILGDDIASRYAHLAEALTGEVSVSGVVPAASGGEPIVAVAVPFSAPEGRRVFSAGFQISSTPLDAFIDSSVPIDDSRAFLVDGDGTVITSSVGRAVGRPLAEQAPELASMPLEGAGSLEIDGRDAHYVSAPVEGTPWRVVLTVGEATLYRPLAAPTRLQALSLVVFVGLVAMVVALVLRLARAERRLSHKVVQLEAANRTLDTFSHTLVHDLRNPLTAIGGFAHTLSRILGDADDRVQEMTAHIETSAERMQALIEDVLALATATRSIQRVPCDPRVLLAEAADDMRCLELEVGWMPEVVEADRSSLYRCFQNLLANACAHAAGPDGIVRVIATAEETPWSWRFAFEDDGPGVDDADRRRIFEAFERGVDAARGTGTGLGLSIVAACANAHGGSVAVENAPAGGARFVMEIGKPSRDSSEERDDQLVLER